MTCVLTYFHRRLISGTVGTVVHYGFQCNTHARSIFLVICLINGLAGTIIPFWDWFDRNENKVFIIVSPFRAARIDDTYLQKWRIAFFVSMTVLITLGPLAQLTLLHSLRDTLAFIRGSLF